MPEFNQPSRATAKVVHEEADVSADSVPYVLLLEYSNKPSESDEERPCVCGEYKIKHFTRLINVFVEFALITSPIAIVNLSSLHVTVSPHGVQ